MIDRNRPENKLDSRGRPAHSQRMEKTMKNENEKIGALELQAKDHGGGLYTYFAAETGRHYLVHADDVATLGERIAAHEASHRTEWHPYSEWCSDTDAAELAQSDTSAVASYSASGWGLADIAEWAGRGWSLDQAQLWAWADWEAWEADQWVEDGGDPDRVPRHADGSYMSRSEWLASRLAPSDVYAAEDLEEG